MFSYMKVTYRLVARHVVGRGFTRGGKSIHSKKCRGDPQETRRKYTGPFAGIGILVYLRDREFVYPN